MKASKVTRTLPAVQKGIFDVRIFGEGMAGRRINADTRYGRDWDKFAQREDWGLRRVFDSVFFHLEGIYMLSLI